MTYKFKEEVIEQIIKIVILETSPNAKYDESILKSELESVKKKVAIELNLPLLFK